MDYLLPAALRDGLLTYMQDQPWKEVQAAIPLLQGLKVAPEPSPPPTAAPAADATA